MNRNEQTHCNEPQRIIAWRQQQGVPGQQLEFLLQKHIGAGNLDNLIHGSGEAEEVDDATPKMLTRISKWQKGWS